MLLQNLKKTNQSQILKVQDVSFSIYEPKENGLKSIAFKICNDLLQCTTLRCLIKGGGQNKPGGGRRRYLLYLINGVSEFQKIPVNIGNE